jgi:CheY-like chemotaxis protein
MRILFIDDDEHVRGFTVTALERAGHEVSALTDGAGLSAAVEAAPPDVVVTDLFMPNVDGFESIRTLTGRWPNVAVLAVTGGGRGVLQVTTPYLTMARALGVDAVLAKPYTVEQLLRSIAEAVAERNVRTMNRRDK